jgi:hypothetical protein
MSKRILFTTMLFLLRATNTFPQALTATDGELVDLFPGNTYTLQPIPLSDTSVSPVIGPAWGEPMAFVLNAPAGFEYRVSFLASGNVGLCGGSISSSFSTTALRWEEMNERLDPDHPQTITVDSGGMATLYLGISITLPADTRSFEYVARVKCLMVGLQTGDSVSASASFIASVFRDPNSSDTWGEMRNLSRGYSYSLAPGTVASPIAPLINGREQGSTAQYRTDAGPGRSVQLAFTLPTYLTGDQNGNLIPCRFSSDAVYVEETGNRMDPHKPDTVAMGSSCSLTLDMGVTISVPRDAPAGWYLGNVIGQANYTGTARHLPRHAAASEFEMTFAIQVSDLDIPKSFSLLQNYPNPFNSTTTITYGLPVATNVSLGIFDLVGREITTLVEGYQYAGWHKIDWKTGDVASGSYFYKLSAGNFTQVKKVLLVR